MSTGIPCLSKHRNIYGERTTLLAMVVYWLLASGTARLFVMGKPVSVSEADEKLREQDK
ncbi:MAG: hypothetical protein PHT88_00655 [Candidatus Moranbacteria bacterium]|nr:hypothetical protein [Candidatus Moranbacteria bacterium]